MANYANFFDFNLDKFCKFKVKKWHLLSLRIMNAQKRKLQSIWVSEIWIKFL